MQLKLSRLALEPMLDSLAAGLHWWLAELRGMVPAAVLRRVVPDRPTLVLASEGDAVLLGHLSRGSYIACGRIEAEAVQEPRPAPLAAALARFRPTRVELRLPKAQVLEQRLILPLAAARRLPLLLRFELDRQTPFSPEQIYYDARIITRDLANKRMVALVALTKRTAAERALGQARHWGLFPTRLAVEGDPGWSLDFRAMAVPAAAGTRRHRLSIALAGLALILALAAWHVHAAAQDTYVEALDAELTNARAAAEATKVLQRDLAVREAKLAFLKRRLLMPSAGNVLEDLAARLPDDSWVTTFELSGSTIRLHGFSRAAVQLSTVLAGSPILLQPQLASSPGAIAGEQFDLSASLRSEEPR